MPALELWCAVQTQWRHGGFAGPTGLDYAGVRSSPAFRALGARRERIFADLCVMEFAALAAWADRRSRSGHA